MLTLKAIKAVQKDVTLFVTSLGLADIRRLRKSDQLDIEVFDPTRPREKQGYQRGIDPKKIREIARFVSRDRSDPGADVLLPIMPTAVVLNCRPGPGSSMPRFDSTNSELTIPDRAILYVVDGQHRIEGLKESELKEGYEIPVIIICELGIVQEAAQFLTINSKQMMVRPDLQLRVLFSIDPANTNRLIDILHVDKWKLGAQLLAIALNDRNESPWRNLIRRPNETLGGWKPMREAGFVDTLRPMTDASGPMSRVATQDKETFLLEYWEAVRGLYPDAFRQDTGKRYHVCKTIGAGSFHSLAPFVFHFRKLHPARPLHALMDPVRRRAKLPAWAGRTGKFSRMAARQSSYREVALEFALAIEPRLSLVNRQVLGGFKRRKLTPADEKVLARAERLLSPLSFRFFDANRTQESGQRGCYCLVKFVRQSPEVYIGKGDNVGDRLGGHDGYDLYAYQTAGSQRQMETLEMALYHLLNPGTRENQNHPPPTDACPYC